MSPAGTSSLGPASHHRGSQASHSLSLILTAVACCCVLNWVLMRWPNVASNSAYAGDTVTKVTLMLYWVLTRWPNVASNSAYAGDAMTKGMLIRAQPTRE